MELQGRGKRGRPKRRWLDRARGDIKEKGLSGGGSVRLGHMEAYAIKHRLCPPPHKNGNKIKRKKIATIEDWRNVWQTSSWSRSFIRLPVIWRRRRFLRKMINSVTGSMYSSKFHTITMYTYNIKNLLRGFAKFKQFQKSKIKLGRAHPTHPPSKLFYFWKPITDMDKSLKS